MIKENFENLKHFLQGSSPDDAVICPPGHYCEEGSSNAVPCEKGVYSVPSNIFIPFPSPIWYINFKLLKLVGTWCVGKLTPSTLSKNCSDSLSDDVVCRNVY